MASLAHLLAEHSYLKLQANNKILCDVTGHEMSARADVVQSYINGKKFKKELEWYKHDYSQYLPYIVEDKENPKKLFCKLTKQTLNKIPEEVKKHMEGRRFKRLKVEKEQADALKAAKASKKTSDDEDDEDRWDPSMMEELVASSEDEQQADDDADEDEDNMSDLLPDSSGDEGEDDGEDEGDAENRRTQGKKGKKASEARKSSGSGGKPKGKVLKRSAADKPKVPTKQQPQKKRAKQ